MAAMQRNDTIESATPAARHWLSELFDDTGADGRPPLTIVSVADQARRRETIRLRNGVTRSNAAVISAGGSELRASRRRRAA